LLSDILLVLGRLQPS